MGINFKLYPRMGFVESQALKHVLPKLVFETAATGPIYLGLFMSSTTCFGAFADGKTPIQCLSLTKSKLETDFMKPYVDALHVCPFYQLLNFLFVPLPYRVLFLNTCQKFWNIWSSHVYHNDDTKPVRFFNEHF